MVPTDLERWRGARVLVLGASGFIGRWTARGLARCGAAVVHAVRDAGSFERVARRWDLFGETVVADLAPVGSGAELVARVRPDVVFDLAGHGVDRRERDEALAQRLNAELPAELVDALAALGGSWPGARVVHVGSAAEYGAATGDLAEDSETRPNTLYGRTKLAGTEGLAARARERGLATVTARLFTVYGPGEHAGRLLPSLLAAAHTDQPLELTAGEQRRDFTLVDDVVDGLARLGLAVGEPGSVVNLATGELHSVRAFVETAAEVLGIAAERLRFGAVPTRAEEMAHLPVAVSRCRRVLDWLPSIGIADGVRRTRDFFGGGAPELEP